MTIMLDFACRLWYNIYSGFIIQNTMDLVVFNSRLVTLYL